MSLSCGFTSTARMARRVCWTRVSSISSKDSSARTRFRSIRTSGFTFRSMRVVCCFVMRLRQRRRSARKRRITSRRTGTRMRKRLRSGIMGCFRGLKVWLTLHYYGTRRIAETVSEDMALAAYLGELVSEADDFELLAPVELSICCFRYVPRAGVSEAELNELN